MTLEFGRKDNAMPTDRSSRSTPRDGDSDAKTYSPQEVRQGRIILRKPWQRALFVVGLVGFVVLAVLWHVLGGY
jgi:hypothetical protein